MQRLAITALALITLAFMASPGAHATTPASAAPTMIVKKTATCGCCNAWVDRLKAAGFKVETENMANGQLMQFKIKNGLKPDHMSCHTGKIAGYTIEGHVPVREIKRLILERPRDAVGLAVPGMPMGSPGMDFGDEKDAYNVLLIRKNGSSEVYASYPGNTLR